MAPPPGPVDNLPIKATIEFAYRSVFLNLNGFMRAAIWPLVLSIVLAIPVSALREIPPVAFLVGALATAVPYTIFGVSWYRLVLLGPAEPPPAIFPKWQQRHWRFFSYAILILLSGQAVMILVVSQLAGSPSPEGEIARPDASIMLGALVALLVMSMVLLRLSLVFPAVAVEETYNLGHAWRHTRGQGLRLLAASMMSLLPLVLAGSILLAVLFGGALGDGQQGLGAAQLMFYVVENLIGYLSLGITMAIIAAAFRTCAGWIPSSTGPPGQSLSTGRGPGEGEA